jgi:glycosyltransferase involved in cell wall biosynthesis
MRVLHLIDHLSLGGAQRAVRDLLERRPQDRVLALRRKAPGAMIELPRGALLHAGGASPFAYPALLPRIWLAQRRGRFDMVHCHLPVSWLFGIMLGALQGRGRPGLLFHERGGVLHRRGPYTWLVRAAVRRGTIVCVSGYIRDRVAERGVAHEALLVMHNAIDLRYFRSSPEDGARFRRWAGFGPQDILAGFAGRLVAEKGWHVLLDSLARFGSKSETKLMVVGIGADADKLQDAIRVTGLEARAIYLGYTEDMVGFYSALDMCIVPSLIEPFGRVQLEAQACGVPVIASRIPGIMETVSSENALLIPPADPGAIMRAVRRLETDPGLRERYRLAGLENVRRFDLAPYLAQLEDLYARIAG